MQPHSIEVLNLNLPKISFVMSVPRVPFHDVGYGAVE